MSNIKSTSGKEFKKKKKFKIPGAISILVGVVIFSIVLTWIIYFSTIGNFDNDILVYSRDGAKLTLNGYWEGGNNWYISKGANAIIDGNWVKIDYNGEFPPTSIGQEINILSISIEELIDGAWFNFGNSNWYISENGMYGIGDILLASIAGFFSASDLILFIIGIGLIIELLMETNILKSLVNSMIKGIKDKKIFLVPLLFVFFSLWGTIMGTQEATIALIPIVVPSLIVAGFDATTGFLIVLVGCTTGIAASILEPFALGTLAGAFDEIWQDSVGVGSIGIGTGILLRIILFVVYTSIGALFVTWYANRVLKHNKSIETNEMIDQNKNWARESFSTTDHTPLDKKQKIVLGVVSFILGWMILVLLPWSNWIPGLDEQQWWQALSHIFFFNSLIGHWTFFQLGFLFIFGWFICAKIFNYNSRMMKRNWKNSLVSFKLVSLILIISRTSSIILSDSGSADYLAKSIFQKATDGLPPVGLTLVVFPIYILMALFIPSMSGLAGISAPIIAPIVQGYSSDPEQMKAVIVGILALYPLAQGLVNMTSPTTGLVVAEAEASHADYGKSVKLLLSYASVIGVIGLLLVSSSFFIPGIY